MLETIQLVSMDPLILEWANRNPFKRWTVLGKREESLAEQDVCLVNLKESHDNNLKS